MKSARYISTFIIVFITGMLRAQQSDFVLITGMGVTKNLNRAWDLSVGTQLNFNQNAQELWFGFADASIGYRLNRNWNSEFHMREIQYRQLDNSYRARRLFYHTLTWSKGFGKWSFSARNRLQQLIFGEHFSDDFKGPLWYNRNRIAVRYRINYYWAPYLSAECMLPLNRPTRNGIDQYRVAMGMSYTANDYVRVDSYYQIQHQLQRSSGNNSYFVLGLNLSIKIP